MTDFVEMKGL